MTAAISNVSVHHLDPEQVQLTKLDRSGWCLSLGPVDIYSESLELLTEIDERIRSQIAGVFAR